MGQFRCRVLRQTQVTEDVHRISLEATEIARGCSPGQFLHLRVSPGTDPLLRRPFSIHRVDRTRGTVEILYRVVGRGTEMMREFEGGDSVDVMGPLGQGFALDGSFRRALVVAGGMGSAPVFFLISELLVLRKRVTLFWGVKKGSEIFDLSHLEASGVEVHVATEDGSLGHQGLVTDRVELFLSDLPEPEFVEGFVCGPKEMLKRVQELTAGTAFQWQVSLEERMVCGVGVCMGCAVRMKQGGYRMVCSDGPVFNLKEVVFDG